MPDLSFLISSRKYIRSSVTKLYSNKNYLLSKTFAEKKVLALKLEDYLEKLHCYDEQILEAGNGGENKNEEQLHKEMEACEEYSDKIRECLSIIKINDLPVTDFTTEIQRQNVTRTLLKSPTAPLPIFSSLENESLKAFLDNFEETVNKFNYTDYDKFLLLSQQIKGKASCLLESLEPNKRTYQDAKKLLTEAFASSDLQKFNVLKQLSELKLSYNDEPFHYMSKLRKIIQSFEILKITTSDILQYFFLRGLNDLFRNQLVQITNVLRPTLDQIMEHFFAANERYSIARKLNPSEKKVKSNEQNLDSTLMVSSTGTTTPNRRTSELRSPFDICSLCSTDGKVFEHAVNKCPTYTNSKEKIDRLKSLNSCTRCAHSDHNVKNCKYRFKKPCNFCSKWHYTFLCVHRTDNHISPKTQHKTFNEGTSRKTQSSLAIIATTSVHAAAEEMKSILPTFTCMLPNGKILRGLRDTGSQNNFIKENCLKNCNYEIIEENIDLTVKGINCSKNYKTKMILAKLKLGDDFTLIKALVLPSIDISLTLPELSKIAKRFRSRGYILADDHLYNKDNIDDIDIILGSESSHLFTGEVKQFGINKLSVYFDTPFGVMLMGNLSQMLVDVDSLNCSDKYKEINKGINLSNNHGYNYQSCSFATSICITNPDNKFCSDHHNATIVERAEVKELETQCNFHLNKEDQPNDDLHAEINKDLVKYLIENVERKPDGRLILPLLWNGGVSHLLANNYKLALNVLNSSKKKLLKNASHLTLMDETIKELEDIGAVEKITNLEEYLKEHPTHSFLAHMPVIRLNKETTKCRIVYLSNLKEKGLETISHNQAMHSGPCLNHKMTLALLLLRFDEKLLVFDIKKAFLQIELKEADQCRLLFLWFKNVSKNDFSVQCYKNIRLSFGLRCSPTILMVALYKILILDADCDEPKLKNLKTLIYSLLYMDNGAITANSSEGLKWAFDQLNEIFNPYRFELQQYNTNDVNMQSTLDPENKTETELLGLLWNMKEDSLKTREKKLNGDAKTKRNVLKSIAENFDPFQFDCPTLNRARLFMHRLQSEKELDWDSTLNDDLIKQWKCISLQVNNSPALSIPRFVGSREDSYTIIAFCDSSKLIYGTVVYIQSETTGRVSFLLSKNRIISNALKDKSIPCLELLSIVLGAETIVQLKTDLSAPLCLTPINISNIVVYSDSLVALSWINNYFVKLDKMNKKSVYIMNRLKQLEHLSEKQQIYFSFVEGFDNPADCVTRPVSHKVLSRTNYLEGPSFLNNDEALLSRSTIMKFSIPHTNGAQLKDSTCLHTTVNFLTQPILKVERYSKFARLVAVYKNVLTFINKLKRKINKQVNDEEIGHKALNLILRTDQQLHFPEVFEYFAATNGVNGRMPNIVAQLNVFIDVEGILRVGSKMLKKENFKSGLHCPILLDKNSPVANLIIRDTHEKLYHSGLYSVLNELKKKFWVPHFFSTVKKVLKKCVHCRKFNNRTLKLNQSPYRDFRMDPEQIPFSQIFMDYLGPFAVKQNGINTKVYILCITCLYTRAINLKVSLDLTNTEFLRSFQLHCFEYGVPQFVYSDLGSQFVASASIITDFFNDFNVANYFREHGASVTTFNQYFKGHNQLGSLVEICVKLTKRLLFGAFKKYSIDLRHFEFIVANAVHLVNRRPIALKDNLRSVEEDYLPAAITPEALIHGHDLLSINVIPYLQKCDEEWSPTAGDPVSLIRKQFDKLRTVRDNLYEIYHTEFISTLIKQATNIKDRYKPVVHQSLQKGDIVVVKEDNHKPTNYPIALVKELQTNDLGEITGAILWKGKTREIIKRHSSRLVPILRISEYNEDSSQTKVEALCEETASLNIRPKRRAAIISENKTRQVLKD